MSVLLETRTPWCINESFVQRCLERDPGGLLRVLRGEECILHTDARRVA